jgi:ankyrin repeat protein
MAAAAEGHGPALARILAHPDARAAIDDLDNAGRSALDLACLAGHPVAVRELLRGGADFVGRQQGGRMGEGGEECRRLLDEAERGYVLHKARALSQDEEGGRPVRVSEGRSVIEHVIHELKGDLFKELMEMIRP